MNRLTIYKENSSDSITLSNRFIDTYLAQANDAQIKVYLYLLRMVSASVPTSISDIADKFNHTERDVTRALKYWANLGLLSIEYDKSGEICGLQFPELSEQTDKNGEAGDAGAKILSLFAGEKEAVSEEQTPVKEETKVVEKRTYSRNELAQLKSQEDFANLLFATETYFGRPLTTTDLQVLAFIREELGFSTDLLEYLIEYCVSGDHRDFRYIEKVALAWNQSEIKTVAQAKRRSSRYDKIVYKAMQALGRRQEVTQTEADYVLRWYHEYGFSEAVILYACEKAVLAVDKNRITYADGILKNWHAASLKTLSQIQKAEEKKAAQKAAAEKTKTVAAGNAVSKLPHNQYAGRSIDFDGLEKELLKYQ